MSFSPNGKIGGRASETIKADAPQTNNSGYPVRGPDRQITELSKPRLD